MFYIPGSSTAFFRGSNGPAASIPREVGSYSADSRVVVGGRVIQKRMVLRDKNLSTLHQHPLPVSTYCSDDIGRDDWSLYL